MPNMSTFNHLIAVFPACITINENANRHAIIKGGIKTQHKNQALPFFFSFFFFASPPPDGSPIPIIPGGMPGSPAGIPGIPGMPPIFSISAIASLNGLSLTPPPEYAGEWMGRIFPIFQPRGAAGASGSLSGIGRPWIRSLYGDFSVVGWACKNCATRI